MSPKHRQKTSLFSRILLRLSLPLVILAIILVASQLTGQIHQMNRLIKLNSLIALEKIQNVFIVSFDTQNPEPLSEGPEKKIEIIRETHRIEQVQLFNLLTREPFWGSKFSTWSPFDDQALQQGVEKNLLKSFHATIDKVQKKVTYLFFR